MIKGGSAMSSNSMVSRVENDCVLILERVFDAPRDFLFKMFKEPEHLKRAGGGQRDGKFQFAPLISVQEAFGTTA